MKLGPHHAATTSVFRLACFGAQLLALVMFTGCTTTYRVKALRDTSVEFSKSEPICWELLPGMAIEGRRLFANLEPILLEQGFNLKPASEAKYILRFDVFGISIREYKTATISCRLFRLTSEGQNFDPTSLWDAKILLPDAYAVNRPDDALRTLLAQFGKEIDKESVPVVRVGQ